MEESGNLKIICIGAVNIDLIAMGLASIPKAGGQEVGEHLELRAGGKACNMARMCGKLVGAGNVAMLAKTVKDASGLWQVPVESLREYGVLTGGIILAEPAKGELPTMALVLQVKQDANRVLYFMGRNETLSMEDIDRSTPMFERLAEQNGLLVMSGEMPVDTMVHALELAAGLGIRALVDPGGCHDMGNYWRVLEQSVFFLKPNAAEVEEICGVRIFDLATAGKAASRLMQGGVQNLLITHGGQGAYLFTDGEAEHIQAEGLTAGQLVDTTGSGDQVIAVVAAGLLRGLSIVEAVRLGVRAGTRQCTRLGAIPLSWQDL